MENLEKVKRQALRYVGEMLQPEGVGREEGFRVERGAYSAQGEREATLAGV